MTDERAGILESEVRSAKDEVITDFRWLADQYAARVRVGVGAPVDELRVRLEVVERWLEQWLHAHWPSEYKVEHGYRIQERWMPVPAFLVREIVEPNHANGPILALWIGLLPWSRTLSVALIDVRAQRHDIASNPLAAEQNGIW